MELNKKHFLILSILLSLILHILLVTSLVYFFKKKILLLSKLPPIPKETIVEIVTLPKRKTEGMAKIFSKKEKLPFGFASKPLMVKKKPKLSPKVAKKITIKPKPKVVMKKPKFKVSKKAITKPKIKMAKKKSKLIKKSLSKPKFAGEKPSIVRKGRSKVGVKKRTKKQLYAGRKLKEKPKRLTKNPQEKVVMLKGGLFRHYPLKPGFLSGEAKQYEYKKARREATISIGTQSIKYASYLEHIKNKIENVWAYPVEAAQTGQQGKLLLLFSIDKNGNLIRLKLIRSSGYPLLDRAALEAVRDAAPFPPLPKRFNLDVLNIYATFEYQLGLYYIQ